jgi:hypothetical protein
MKVIWENLRERDHLEYRDTYRIIILKWILKKWNVRIWPEFE